MTVSPLLIGLHATAQPTTTWLSAISITNLPVDSNRLPVHLAIDWLLVVILVVAIGSVWGSVSLGGAWKKYELPAVEREGSESPLRADSENTNESWPYLLVEIPPHLRSQDAISKFLGSVAPSVEVLEIDFVRDTAELEDLLSKRMDEIEKIEELLERLKLKGEDGEDLLRSVSSPTEVSFPL